MVIYYLHPAYIFFFTKSHPVNESERKLGNVLPSMVSHTQIGEIQSTNSKCTINSHIEHKRSSGEPFLLWLPVSDWGLG